MRFITPYGEPEPEYNKHPRDLGSLYGYKMTLFTTDERCKFPLECDWPIYAIKFKPGGRSFVSKMAINPIVFLDVDQDTLNEFLKDAAFEKYIMYEKQNLHNRIDKIFEKGWKEYIVKEIGNCTLHDAHAQFGLTLGDLLKQII